MSTPDNNPQTIVDMVTSQSPPTEELSVTSPSDITTIIANTEEKTSKSEVPASTTESKDTFEGSVSQTKTKGESTMLTSATSVTESSTTATDKCTRTTEENSEIPTNTKVNEKSVSSATAQLKNADTTNKVDDVDPTEEDEEFKKDLGTDHYMHFLICVFCPWWLFIWIFMCARDIYKGTCCKNIEESD